jgi:hypothetical protein
MTQKKKKKKMSNKEFIDITQSKVTKIIMVN